MPSTHNRMVLGLSPRGTRACRRFWTGPHLHRLRQKLVVRCCGRLSEGEALNPVVDNPKPFMVFFIPAVSSLDQWLQPTFFRVPGWEPEVTGAALASTIWTRLPLSSDLIFICWYLRLRAPMGRAASCDQPRDRDEPAEVGLITRPERCRLMAPRRFEPSDFSTNVSYNQVAHTQGLLQEDPQTFPQTQGHFRATHVRQMCKRPRSFPVSPSRRCGQQRQWRLFLEY